MTKTETSETCLDKMTSTVSILQEINPGVKIVVSNIAPRGDAEVLDINRQEFNIKLLKEYSLHPAWLNYWKVLWQKQCSFK